MPASCRARIIRSRRLRSTESASHSTWWNPSEKGGWCRNTIAGPLCSFSRATIQLISSSEYRTWTSRDQRFAGSAIGFESSAMNRTQPSAESKQ